MRRAGTPTPLLGAALLAGAAGVALALWQGTLTRQSPAAHWCVGLAIAVIAVLALVAGRGRQRRRSGEWVTGSFEAATRAGERPGYAAGVVVWVVLLAAVIGWDLNSFVHQSHNLPTLSYYVGRVTRFVWGRALVFAAWLAVGAWLALARRRPASTTPPPRRGHRRRVVSDLMVSGVVVGGVVWSALALIVVVWLVVTTVAGSRRLPGIVDVARWFCDCWLGRLLAVCAWAGAGWHLFCQRP